MLFKINLFLLVASLCLSVANSGFLTWIFGSKATKTQTTRSSDFAENGAALVHGSTTVPFEITTEDEKFLSEAKAVMKLSDLDACHHKVITWLLLLLYLLSKYFCSKLILC